MDHSAKDRTSSSANSSTSTTNTRPSQSVPHRRPQEISDVWNDSSSEDETEPDDDASSASSKLMAPEDDRDGKFTNLSRFMTLPSKSFKAHYQTMPKLRPAPGWIIHIQDREEVAIDRRVMLVIQKLTQSVMCLSFCLHWPPRTEDHWSVSKVQKGERADTSNVLELRLRPSPDSELLTPGRDVTINLRDIWNIETISEKIEAARLGRVRTSTMQALSLKVQEVFAQHMNEAIPQPGGLKRRRCEGGPA